MNQPLIKIVCPECGFTFYYDTAKGTVSYTDSGERL